jgi:undecaprenyl-diphosphatase
MLVLPTIIAGRSNHDADLLRAFGLLSRSNERLAVVTLQVVIFSTFLGLLATPLFTRRYRLFGYLAGSMVAAGGLAILVQFAFGVGESGLLGSEMAERLGVTSTGFPSRWAMASVSAAFVALSPFVTRRWRHVGIGLYVVIVTLRILLTISDPVVLFLSMALGGTVGAIVLFLFGRPDERPTNQAVIAATVSAGVPLAQLDPANVDARGSIPYFGTLVDGHRVFIKVLGTGERSADLLFRIYRYLRFRNLGDERPFSSLRRSVEHEAFISLHARDIGVRTPRMRAVASVGADGILLAFDQIEGGTIDGLDPDQLTDELIREVWVQAALLREHRIAHRDLRRANILVDPDGQPWIIDFGFAEAAASESILNADVAQLVTAMAVLVGAERSVDVAHSVIGNEALASALPRLQMGGLSGATQTALKARPGMLEEIQETIKTRTGAPDIVFEPIQRVTAKQIFTVVMLVAITYFLLPQLADLPAVWANVRGAHWLWFIPVVIVSALSYVGATVSFLGVIPDRLQVFPTFMTQVASSFVSKVAPAGLGGMALNVRYAQKSGVDSAVAVSGVGMNAGFGSVLHIFLTLFFMFWAGRDAFGSLSIPQPHSIALGLLGVLLFTVIGFAIPSTRRLMKTKVLPVLARGAGATSALFRSPLKLLLVLGGSLIVTMSSALALYFATRAFGGDLRFSVVGAAYLAGSAVAVAAPTPGGLGAVEAALIAGLTASGMPGPVALPAVFLMRLGTFWMPILPGWFCFSWLRRSEHI